MCDLEKISVNLGVAHPRIDTVIVSKRGFFTLHGLKKK